MNKLPLALILLPLLATAAAATLGADAAWQPDNVTEQFRVGSSTRICPTTTPDLGSGLLTHPDATTTTPAIDGEGCYAVTFTAAGTYTLGWTVATAPKSVTAIATGSSAPDWNYWIVFGLLAAILIAGLGMDWILVSIFAFIGLIEFALIDASILAFSFKGTLALVVLGFALEYAANAYKARRNRRVKG